MKTLVKILLWAVAVVIGLPLLVLVLSPLWRKPWIEPLPGVRLTPARPVIAEKDLPPDSAFMRFRKAEAAFVKPGTNGIDKDKFNAETKKLFLEPWSEEAFPEMTKTLAVNEKALSLAREAAAIPDAQVPSATLLGDIRVSPTNLFLLLDASAARQAEKGLFDTAIQDLLTGIHLGDIFSRGGCLIDRLYDIQATVVFTKSMRRLSLAADIPSSAANHVVADLLKVEQNLEPWPETFRWELLQMQDAFRLAYRSGFAKGPAQAPCSLAHAFIVKYLAYLGGSSKEKSLQNLGNVYAHLIKFAETPEDSETPEKFTNALEAKKHGGVLSFLAIDDPIGFTLAGISLPVLADLNTKHVERLATLRATQAVIAIRQFQQANARLPGSLGELVPQFLPSVPEDPFDHKPLRYVRKSDTAWAVYSVGRNRIDDGGKEPKSNSSADKREADLVFSSTEAADALAKLNAEKPAR